MKKVKIRYSDVLNIVRTIVEQDEESQPEIVEVPAEDIIKYLEYVSYNGDQLSKFPQFRGKQIKVIGKLNLRGTALTSLGPIVDSDNVIDISNTNVRSFGNYKGSKRLLYYSGTPLMKLEIQKEIRKKQNKLDSYRENDEWNLEKGDEIGEKAWALLYYLQNSDDVEVLTQDDSIRKSQMMKELGILQDKYDNTTDPDEIDELSDQISELEEKISEFDEYIDVYDLYPEGKFYEMTEFKINRYEYHNNEYAVGDQREIERSAYEYAENLIDDIGIGGFNRSFIEDYVDADQVIDFMDYDSDVRNNLDIYFDSNDYDEFSYALSKELRKLKENLSELEKKYNEFLEQGQDENASELEDEMDELRSEIEEIESSPDEVSEERIQEKVDELNDDVRRDPLSKIHEMGFDPANFINMSEFVKGYVESDGYGMMNSYNGDYDTIEVNGTTYYIMQVAG